MLLESLVILIIRRALYAHSKNLGIITDGRRCRVWLVSSACLNATDTQGGVGKRRRRRSRLGEGAGGAASDARIAKRVRRAVSIIRLSRDLYWSRHALAVAHRRGPPVTVTAVAAAANTWVGGEIPTIASCSPVVWGIYTPRPDCILGRNYQAYYPSACLGLLRICCASSSTCAPNTASGYS